MARDLSPRQQREQEYFDEYWEKFSDMSFVNLDPIAGREHRPWNSYWYVFAAARNLYDAGARSLLDVGCGGGTHSVMLAYLGYEVWGFDVSPNSIDRARELAEAHQVADRCRFSVQTSEDLTYPDDSFDVAVGIDILHHVEISPTLAECLRVLKPGGTAIFREWCEAPVFDRLRNTSLARHFFPTDRNMDKWDCKTTDEKKLNADDMAAIRGLVPGVVEKRFTVLSRLDRFLRPRGARSASTLEKVDYWLGGKLPAVLQFGGSVVYVIPEAAGSPGTRSR